MGKMKDSVTDKPKPTEAELTAKRAAKGAKFVEVAEKRVAKAIQAVRLIGNLASPNYVYTPEQVDKIIVGLQTEVDTIYEAFKAKKSKEKVSFKL